MRYTPGTRLNQYEVRSLIASGGGGEVYLAHDTQLERTVALKVLAASTDNGVTDLQVSFLKEARAASALNHPNILTIHEIGSADSIVFMATEFVEGETLRTRLLRESLSLRDALDISLQIISALAAAHSKGLIHCDLKPENITLRADGLVKILDFGLSRCAQEEDTDATGNIAGTIGYLAPEQLRGDQPDARTDLWAFGVVLFEMLTGKQPFARARVHDELRAIQSEEPPTLSSLRAEAPLALESIVRRALTKDANARYQSALEISSDLKLVEKQLSVDSLSSTLKFPSQESTSGSAAIIPDRQREPHVLVRGALFSETSKRRFFWLGTILIVLAVMLLPFAGVRGGVSYAFISLIVLGGLCLAARFIPISVTRSTPTVPAASVAFRGLVPFQEADRDSFYGREIETRALFAMVTREQFRFGALFGESGCGKTSLILAGLIPRLWDEGYVPLYCRAFADPLVAIMEECRKRSHLEQQANETTTTYLQRVVSHFDAPLIIICDQFEEFFVNFRDAAEREPFIRFVADCHSYADLPVHFLFSLRSDFLYQINAAFAGRVSEPLLSSKLYHLRNFDEGVAEEILERSARAASLPFEPGLNKEIARDLAVNHMVAPSEMQIVGAQLQARHVFTFDGYRRTGGKEALVHDFLEDLIQASGEADNARLFLRSLISEENTRLTLSIAQICKRTQRNGEVVSRLLQLFTSARLIRELQDHEPWRYELVHEYLIDKINRVTGQVLDATQRANRHFRQYLSNYSLDQRTRVPLTRLWFIRRYSDLPRTKRERELLQKSMRWGLVKAFALVLALAVITTAAAAFLSVDEEWRGVRLSDGHSAASRRVIFSQDGKRLVSCGEDGKIIVWDFASRQRIATLTDHKGWVNWIDFSPDGKWLASAGQDHLVIIWDAMTFAKVTVLREHHDSVSVLVFSPDGRWLVTSSGLSDSRVVVWEVNGWRKVREIPEGVTWGQYFFSPDSRRLITAADRSWDIETGRQLTDNIPEAGNYGDLFANGTRLITIDGTGNVCLFDLLKRKVINQIRAHQFHGRVATFSPDEKLAATGAEDIVLWDAATLTKLARLTYTAEVWGLAFSPDGRWLVSSHNDGAILVWDVKEREEIANFNEHSASVRGVAFSGDGKYLASAGEDRTVIVWDIGNDRKDATLLGHKTRVTSLAFAPTNDWLATGDQDGHVMRWDLKERRLRWLFIPPTGLPSYSVVVSPDGRWVAHTNGVSDSADGHLVIDWLEFETRERIGGQFYGLAFLPDGSKLVGVTNLGHVVIWETSTWRMLEHVEIKRSLICVAVAPDGKHFVTGEDEGVLRLWETNGLRQESIVGHHEARVKSVDFSPDGSEIVSASDDQTISLWNVARRRLITHLGAHTAPVLGVDFAPDGKRIASAGQDKSVHIYTRHRTLWGYTLN